MKTKNKGFTLIELMVTVSIIAILGTIAVPAYQDYTIRSQVAEGLSLASGAKVAVAEYYSNHGRYPESIADIGMVSSQGSFIQETRLDEEGKITAVFGNDSNKAIHNGTISLIPAETENGNLTWNCYAKIEQKFLPNACTQDGKINSDGSISYADGSTEYPDGRVQYADGTIEHPNGNIEYPNGDIKKPNGDIDHPDGSRTRKDGSKILKNGNIQLSAEQMQKYGNFKLPTFSQMQGTGIYIGSVGHSGFWGRDRLKQFYPFTGNFNQNHNNLNITTKVLAELYKRQNGGVLPDDFPRPHLDNMQHYLWMQGKRDF
jgi:type IV pilus assembly protein PilA